MAEYYYHEKTIDIDHVFPENMTGLISNAISLPEGFKFPESIKELYLSNLTSLPAGFEFPESLERLHCGLTSLPEGFKFPENLNILYLNDLTGLPEGFKFNDLTGLPEGFKFPESIKYLHLDSLTSLPEGFKFHEGLVCLSIRKLTKIYKGFDSSKITFLFANKKLSNMGINKKEGV